MTESSPTPQTPPAAPESGAGLVAGGLGAAILGGIFALIKVGRVFSSNRIEMTKDRVEGQLLETVMKERDAAVARADRLQAQSNLDSGTIAGLTEKNLYITKELARVQAQYERVETELDSLKNMMSNLKSSIHVPSNPTVPPVAPRDDILPPTDQQESV
ncbi:hypothetical protein Lumi_032 [Xylophilus phage Lumi]|nr:hypothetical protein Lumi_032 [Xylophilus phage Lumi]